MPSSGWLQQTVEIPNGGLLLSWAAFFVLGAMFIYVQGGKR